MVVWLRKDGVRPVATFAGLVGLMVSSYRSTTLSPPPNTTVCWCQPVRCLGSKLVWFLTRSCRTVRKRIQNGEATFVISQ